MSILFVFITSNILGIVIVIRQGKEQMKLNIGEKLLDEKYPYGCTLQTYLQACQPTEVYRWLKTYLILVCVYYGVWLFICFI